jgi:pimeloyl-ACP methyl ester carboxylesterase
LLLAAASHAPAEWTAFAERLAGLHRVIALAWRGTGNDLAGACRSVAGGTVLIAHGGACKDAARYAASGAAGLVALVLSDCPADDVAGLRVAAPVLILRGRQSGLMSHAEAVALREAFPGSRLIEPEECGSWPFGSCPDAAAEAVEWFLSSGATPVMEFGEIGESEPVDPGRIQRRWQSR